MFVNIPFNLALLSKIDELITSPVIVLFEVNVPSLTTLPDISAFETNVPEFDILSLTLIPPAFVKLESVATLIAPCSIVLSAVIVPFVFKVPLPVKLPNEFVPATVNLSLLLISPKFVNDSTTVVLFVFVYVVPLFTTNPFCVIEPVFSVSAVMNVLPSPVTV